MTKLLPRIVIVFVAATLLGYLIHGVLLRSDYQTITHLQRKEPLFPFLLLGNLAFSTALVSLYALTSHASPIRGGVVFGFLLWLLWPVPIFLIDYAGQPIPGILAAKQIMLELPDMLALGLLTAWLYRSPSTYSAGSPIR